MRRDFHDDLVLVQFVIDRRNLTLPECIVKDFIDDFLREAKACHRVPVEDEHGLQPPDFLIGIQVGEHGQSGKRPEHFRRPFAQFGQVVTLQGVLVLGICHAATHTDVLNGLQKEGGARL